AVGLQLGPDRVALGAGAAVVAEQAELVLHVVAVLVGQHIGLGEGTAARSELGLEILEEAEVDVDVAIARAVERAGGGRGSAAGGCDLAAEETGLGDRVG